MREKTTKTTNFILGRMCENCYHDGWKLEDWVAPEGPDNLRRCKGCNRIVANLDPRGGYTDEYEDSELTNT